MRKALYLFTVRRANHVANANEGYVIVSFWDDIAAVLWKPEFDD